MDYMIFFGIWIIGGIAFFLANRVQPGSKTSAAAIEPVTAAEDESESSEEDADEGDSEESSDESE